jgi:hypothetical protein
MNEPASEITTPLLSQMIGEAGLLDGIQALIIQSTMDLKIGFVPRVQSLKLAFLFGLPGEKEHRESGCAGAIWRLTIQKARSEQRYA